MSYKLLTNLLFEPRGKHNPSLTYNIKDTVMSEDGSKVYFALDNVPAGIPLTDTNYWMLQMDLSASKNAMDTAAANARTQTDATIASANTRVEDMMGKAAEAVTSVADYATKVGMRVKGETKITKGNPMTIYPDGGSLLKVQTDIPIKQLGNGDPYPAGSRKNLLPITAKTQTSNGVTFTVDNGAITVNGTATANAYLWLCDEFTLQPGTYVMSGIPENFDFTTQGGFADDNWNINRYGVTTLTEAKKVHPYVIIRNGVNTNNVVFKLQLEAGSTATSYVPPSNIRPFVGYDELGLSVARKNLLPNTAVSVTKNGLAYTVNNDGSITVNGTCDSNSFFTICESVKLPKGEYILSGNPKGITYSQVRLYADKYDSMTESHKITLETAKALKVNIVVFRGEVLNNVVFKPMLRLASDTDATYTPYHGSIHTVQLGKTTYQGHYDWLTGKFRAEWGVYTLTGEGSAKLTSASVHNAKCFMSDAIPDAVGNSAILNGAKSSHFIEGVWNDIVAMASPFGKFAINTSNKIGIAYDGTLDEANAWLAAQNTAGTPVQVAYKLATPIEIQLAPNVITAVEDGGLNHIYGDADLTVEWVKPLETSLAEHSNAKVDANNEALLMDVAQKERSIGNPVVINDAVANVAFPHVETEFTPKQSGSGDPYPAGGGKNLLDVAACIPSSAAKDRTVTINGEYITITTNAVTIPQAPLISFDEITLSPGVYTLVLTKALPGMVRTDGSELYVHPGKTFTTFNLSSEFTFSRLAIDLTEGTAVNETFGICIRADNVTDYTPYSNIRPITGYDKLDLNRAGKNHFPVSALSSTGKSDIYTQDKPFSLPAGHYTLSFKSANATTTDMTLALYAGETLVKNTQVVAGETKTTFTLNSAADGLIWYVREAVELTEIQLEAGTHATSYAPYQGTLHTVQIGETVYGGRYNWLTGKLMAEWVCLGFDGSNILWEANNGGTDTLFYLPTFFHNNIPTAKMGGRCICSHAQTVGEPPVNQIGCQVSTTTDIGIIYLNLGVQTGAYEFNQYVAENGVQIAYELSTPIEIQLDPTRITTIPGTNTIFGDGEFTIDWFKSYKKVAEERENLLLDSFTDKAELSGNPIVMTPVGGIPFDSVVTEFAPKQAGSGDPYPAGGGKNLLVDVTVFDTVWLKGVISLTAGITYTLSVQETADALYFSNEGGTVDYATAYNAKHLTYTPETSGIHVLFARYANGADLAYNMMLEKGSAATEYAPYSNIRPITGWDKLELGVRGKNIFPALAESSYTMNGVTFTKQADGSIRAQGTPTAYAYITLTDYKTLKEHGFTEGVHTISGLPEASNAWFVDLIGDANTQNINFYQNGSFNLSAEVKGNGTYAWRIVITPNMGAVYLIFKPQVEFGSTATPYAPYQGKLHTVQIGQTVYSGRFDWLTGKLVAEWAMKTLDGTEAQLHIHDGWSDGTFDVHEFFKDAVSVDGYVAKANIICSHLPVATPADMANDRANIGVGQGQTNVLFARIGKEYNTVELIRAYLAAQKNAGTPVQIAYKLATPIEIQLTPSEIIALTGVNTLYGDGDTIKAKFRQSKDVDILKRLSALETLMTNQTKGE